MSLRNPTFDDYYLVPDEDRYFDDYKYSSGSGLNRTKMRCYRRRMALIFMCIFILILVALLLVFVILPMAVMFSFSLQSTFIFTHFGLPSKQEYYSSYYYPAFKNHRINVRDIDDGQNVTLGVWHILPVALAEEALKDPKFDYDAALQNSQYNVVIYFHGTGESRSDNTRKYQFLSYYFHVITFDYRGYADSSRAKLTEKAVEYDCMQLYQWVLSKTSAPIYVWGHSLGSALAAGTVSALQKQGVSPKGLILESAFTNLEDELYVHPYGKLFAWLPWFEITIQAPLRRNGFIFDTMYNIQNITSSIMILHAEDDSIVPWKFAKKLYDVASRKRGRLSVYYKFPSKEKYNHNFIYQDPFLKFYLMDFIRQS